MLASPWGLKAPTKERRRQKLETPPAQRQCGDVLEGEGTAEEKGALAWEGPTPGRTAAGQTLSVAV